MSTANQDGTVSGPSPPSHNYPAHLLQQQTHPMARLHDAPPQITRLSIRSKNPKNSRRQIGMGPEKRIKWLKPPPPIS